MEIHELTVKCSEVEPQYNGNVLKALEDQVRSFVKGLKIISITTTKFNVMKKQIEFKGSEENRMWDKEVEETISYTAIIWYEPQNKCCNTCKFFDEDFIRCEDATSLFYGDMRSYKDTKILINECYCNHHEFGLTKKMEEIIKDL